MVRGNIAHRMRKAIKRKSVRSGYGYHLEENNGEGGNGRGPIDGLHIAFNFNARLQTLSRGAAPAGVCVAPSTEIGPV